MKTRSRPPLIYVAGPYSSDPEAGTRAAIEMADRLLLNGAAPLVPHLAHYWHAIHPHDWGVWVKLGLAYVERCDAVLRLPGTSQGSDMEREHAHARGIPVFYSLEHVLAAFGLD